MNSVASLFSEAPVRALGWTLLHSLWQAGAVAALLHGALALTTRARARYTLSAGALLLTLVLAAGTFTLAYEPITAASTPPTGLIGTTAGPAGTAIIPTADGLNLGLRATAECLEPVLPALVAAWATGLLLMLLRFGGGLMVVRRLRRTGLVPVPAAWQARLTLLAGKLAVGRPVALRESARVASPVAVGWLRPLILLPLGLLDALPAAQLEAILAHELAHIRRHDYALNLIQALIETLFFFHPAVWWMSARVRQERELCCDDLAVAALNGQAHTLARALAALAAWEAAAPVAYAAPLPARLALGATGGRLLARIKRLVVPTAAEAIRPAEGAVAGSSVVALLLLLVMVTNAVLRLPLPARAEAAGRFRLEPAQLPLPTLLPADTTKKIVSSTSTTVRLDSPAPRRAPNLIIVKDKKDRLREVYVDGKPVPKDKLGEFKPLVEEQLTEARRDRRAGLQADADDRARALAETPRTLADADRRRVRRDVRIQLDGNRADINGRVYDLDSLGEHIGSEIERVFAGIDFNHFDFSVNADDRPGGPHIRIQRRAGPPVPPVPPVPGMAPAPPAPPVPVPAVPKAPRAPRAPKVGDAKAAQRYQQQQRAYEQQMDAYGREMDEYGRKMDEYGRRMEDFGREMERQQNDGASRTNSRNRGRASADRRMRIEVQRETADVRREADDVRRETLREVDEDRREALREADEDRREALRDAEDARRESRNFRVPPPPPPIETNELRDQLRRDGLIGKNDQRFRFETRNGELRINGQKQSTEVAEKYRRFIGPADGNRTISIEVTE